MAKRTKITITRAYGFRSANGREAVLWDSVAKGLELRTRPSAHKTRRTHGP